MMIINRFGLFSVVRLESATPTMAVRARVKEHLSDLLRAAGIADQIQFTPARDYRYRVHLRLPTWQRLLAFIGEIAEQTNNVKGSIEKAHGHDSDLYRFASSVWQLGLAMDRSSRAESGWGRVVRSRK